MENFNKGRLDMTEKSENHPIYKKELILAFYSTNHAYQEPLITYTGAFISEDGFSRFFNK